MSGNRWRRLVPWVERGLFLVAIVAFAQVYVDWLRSERDWAAARVALSAQQREAPVIGDRLQGFVPADDAPVPPEVPDMAAVGGGDAPVVLPAERASVRSAGGRLVGELAIARVNLSALVMETPDPAGLRHAAGHVPGTPLPWQDGNSAVAGHRDSAFRKLADVRPGDEVRLVTPHGTFDYRVTRVFAVYPKDVWVLEEKRAALTLITCFPFRWVGTAPERWIVQADRVTVPESS